MKSVPERISFNYQTAFSGFTNRNDLKSFLKKVLKKEGRKIERVDFIFCTDQFLLDLNRQHLNHNTYTDIITFDLSLPGQKAIAEIYISVERVRENAKLFNTGFAMELHRVIIHGVLHLCGYKDKIKRDQLEMRQKENYYLKVYFK